MNEDYKSYRIGKDITNRLHVLTNTQAQPLAGRDLTLQLITPKGNIIAAQFEITGETTLEFTYHGILQEFLGIYQLTLWENFGKIGQTAVDCVRAFKLVPNTEMEGGTDPEGLDTEVNDLTLDLSTGVRGADGTGIATLVQTAESTEDSGINAWTATLTDGRVMVFYVRNGSKGSDGIAHVDDALSPTSTNPVQNKVIKKALDDKMDSSAAMTEIELEELLR